jgi:O-antigen/teichoic acid export membrane protein
LNCSGRQRRYGSGARTDSGTFRQAGVMLPSSLRRLMQRHEAFVRDLTTLITGRVAAFIFTLAATPLISRLFTPEDYGVGALFAALTLIAVAVASLTWERAVIVAKTRADALRLGRLGWYTLLFVAVIAWLGGMLAWTCGFTLPYSEAMGGWAWLLPLAVIALGAGQIVDGWLTREKRFKPIARSEVALAAVTMGLRIACGALTGSSVWAMITSQVIGRVAKIFVAIRAIEPRALRRMACGRIWRLRSVAARYRDFPLHGAPNQLLRNFSQELPTVVFGVMFAPAVVGYYAMASRLARLPLNLASVALQRVVMQKFAELHNNGRALAPVYAKVTIGLAVIALPAFIFLMLWGEWLCTLVLGRRWTIAGQYVVILAPWLYVLWISNPASAAMTVLRKQPLLFKAQAVLAVARAAVFAIAYVTGASAEETLRGFVLVSAIAGIGSSTMTYVVARRIGRHRGTVRTE